MNDNRLPLWITWRGLAISLFVLVINRSLTGLHETDQLFLARAGTTGEKQQFVVVHWIRSLNVWIERLGIAAGILFLFLASLSIYRHLLHG